MKVEIGALVEKEYGQLVKDKISQVKGVEYVFFATGRSNDLFDQKQFGSFGEASIITIIAAILSSNQSSFGKFTSRNLSIFPQTSQ